MFSLLSVILTLFLSVTQSVQDRDMNAPMVYQRENSGNWTAYNIGRDYLGNITHIASADGTPVAEYSYDPWGRLRNPQSLDFYAAGSEPELFLGRGFTGPEVLPWFGPVNMNARLYDPLLGRFLSPAPYIQFPDFTQNFNRYSYCLNNPLKYTDESGEFIFTTATIVGICVGTAIGAGVGAYQGYKIAERKGLTGSDRTWTIIGGGLIGGVAGGLSALTGAYVAEGMAAAGVGGFYAGAATGGAAGATSGFINGFGMTTLETGNPLQGLNQGVFQGVIGGLSGALVGGLIQGTTSAIKGNDFWDGSTKSASTVNTNTTPNTDKDSGDYSVYVGTDKETGEVKYVGMTKRDPEVRIAEHLRSNTERAGLDYKVPYRGLTYQEARVLEQTGINYFKLENLYNKINSIAPKYRTKYNIPINPTKF